MDIHAPEKPIHSLKEFGIHIAVVTIGILIALGLEGIREAVHDHSLVRETRENFTTELLHDRDFSHRELARDREVDDQLRKLLADMPTLSRQHPEQIAPRLAKINNAGYFLPTDAWQTALSTGALAHFSTEELGRYSNVHYILRAYTEQQRYGRPEEDRAKAFFASRSSFTPAEMSEGTKRLLLFKGMEDTLVNVCEQMDSDFDKVLPKEQVRPAPPK